jgi:hypothetical protein
MYFVLQIHIHATYAGSRQGAGHDAGTEQTRKWLSLEARTEKHGTILEQDTRWSSSP